MSLSEPETLSDQLGGSYHHLKSIQVVDSLAVNHTSRNKLLSKILPMTGNMPILKIVLKLQPPLQKDFDEASDTNSLVWECNTYIDRTMKVDLEIYKRGERRKPASVVTLGLDFSSEEFGDENTITREESGLVAILAFGTAKTGLEIVQLRAADAIKDLDSKAEFVEKLDHFVRTFDAVMRFGTHLFELHPAAKVAASVVSMIFKHIESISKSHKALGNVIRDMNSLLPTVKFALERFHEEHVRDFLQKFLRLVVETAQKATRCYSHTFKEIIWHSISQDEIMGMERDMQKLKENMNLATNVEIKGDIATIGLVVGESQASIVAVEAAVTQIGRVLVSETDEKLIDRLTPPEHCSYDPDYHSSCIPGTRLALLQILYEWARDASNQSSRLYWLYGVAGSGKSCVAASVASTLDPAGHLSGSFFCKRDIPERRDPRRLIQSLAYFLSSTDTDFRDAVLCILQKEHAAVLEKGPQLQFKTLLETPLLQVSQRAGHVPIVFIVDALDECDDSVTVASFLLRTIELAPWLKLVVTSRPLEGISRRFLQPDPIMIRQDLCQVNAEDDILKYIQFQCSSNGSLDVLENELTESQMQALAKRAQGFFIWIDTVLKHVSKLASNELEAVEDLINSKASSNAEEDLDELYIVVLNSVCGAKEETKKILKCVIGLVFVTSRNEPLPAEALHAFIPEDMGVLPKRTSKIVRELASVLTEDSKSHAVRVCHSSFLDFIGDRTRSKEFWTDPADLDAMMTMACLKIMKDGLKFNICHLESSYLLNSDVKDLKDRVSNYISRQLQYSSMYWLDHVSRSKTRDRGGSTSGMLRALVCTERAIFWIEVMSLIGRLSDASTILQNVSPCLRNFPDIPEVLQAASDLRRFVSSFYTAIAHSTPHIYVSALLWTPSDSTISKIQSQSYTQSQSILEHRIRHRTPLLRTLELESSVNAVAYSPDGYRIVSGSVDSTLRIWDAHTGLPVGKPLLGHSSYVSTVAWSPDGNRIASGSGDETIRIWDAHTGLPVGEPLQGHSSSVTTVAYSGDGSRIVSGSDDKTLRIWDVLTGHPIGKSLQGHSGSVKVVAYSPNESKIVSGSHDKTLRIWDAHTGLPVGKPLRGHSDYVTAAAWSSDGNRIVSGSNDKTLRLWNAHTGLLIGEPRLGHSKSVLAVAYSRDGTRIVSGSFDKTLRIWDANTGHLVGEPLQGHTGSIKAVAYSRDGSSIVSGSFDNTLRIWDAQTNLSKPLQGHTNSVWAIAYSGDGSKIVSGSIDDTLRIWDALTGLPVGDPLRGHTGSVTAVAYSRDGSRIVSGSKDTTLRIWDAHTGLPVGEPLRGHSNSVLAVTYSPNGSRIISGSYDKTLRIWDAHTGVPVGKPLRGHSDSVSAVAYSRDGNRIVSGSNDKTLRIWDVQSGLSVGAPLQGHLDPVLDVAYSPSGSRIVSGSIDQTLRVWDALTGLPVGDPLRGHSRSVSAVAYSRDGSRIVSGSYDKTLRIWDANSGLPVGEPLRGHSDSVLAIAYSPDESRIVSGSDDNTLRIWDAHSGLPFGSPLQGDSRSVSTIAYSPDKSTIVLGSHDKTLRIWNAHNGLPVGDLNEEESRWDPLQHCFISISSSNAASNTPGLDSLVCSAIPSSVSEDGWIRCLDGGLLLWVPPEFRNGVCDMSIVCMPKNAPGHPLRVNWKGICHGRDWTGIRDDVSV